MRAARVVASLVTLAACAQQAPPVESASLGGEDVARVGTTRIEASLVARVAAARGVSPRDAVAFLVDDALAAEGARARGLDSAPAVRWAATALRARSVAAHIREEALAVGAPTDDEIAQLTEFHWLELDLPEQVRVVHAVVLRKDPMTPDAIARARAVVADIRAAVVDATSPEDFEAKARAVPHAGVEVVVQPLPPFVEDGRVAAPGNQRMHRSFAEGAFAIDKPGATSPIVESEAGWHVIRLVERLPAKRVALAERRARLTDEVYAARARGEREALLARLREQHRVQISPAAEATMASVSSSHP